MGLFPAVKKLYHFEIPIGYCYSPLDGGIMCAWKLYKDHIYPLKQTERSYDAPNVICDCKRELTAIF